MHSHTATPPQVALVHPLGHASTKVAPTAVAASVTVTVHVSASFVAGVQPVQPSSSWFVSETAASTTSVP